VTPLASIDTTALGKVVLASLVGGIVIIGAYSVALYAGTRAAEVRRDGRAGAATLYGVISILGLVVFVAAVVVGVIVMTTK
jgi:hypothetical protein